MKAVILAGGLGTRLRSAVPDYPKPMAPIQGRPFLAYQIEYWYSQGIQEFILSVGYKHEAISSFFGTSYQGATIKYVVEPEPMGTGGGLLLALKSLPDDSPFLLLNGDTYFEVNLMTFFEFASIHATDWAMALFSTEDTMRYMGITRQFDHAISSLKTSVHETGTCHANGGVYCVRPSLFSDLALPEGCKLSLEDDILPSIKAAGKRLYGMVCNAPFIDIGIPSDYQRAQTLLPRLHTKLQQPTALPS